MEISLVLPYDRYKKANNIPYVDTWEMFRPNSTESYEKVAEAVKLYEKDCRNHNKPPEKVEGYPVIEDYIITNAITSKTDNSELNYLDLVEKAKVTAKEFIVEWTQFHIGVIMHDKSLRENEFIDLF